MKILAGLRGREAGQGFTLVELLLATVLLMLLVAAMVFSYTTLQRGTTLDEGVAQFKALLRLAQSQAASTGRKVQLVLEAPIIEDAWVEPGAIRLLWEPEPLTQPGQFVELSSAAELVKSVQELVRVDTVRPVDDFAPAAAPASGTNAAAGDEWPEGEFPEQFQIVFYPDGSSDSAEVILAAVDPEDARRMVVRLSGVIGAIRHRLVADEPLPETNTEPERKTARQGPAPTPAEPTAPPEESK